MQWLKRQDGESLRRRRASWFSSANGLWKHVAGLCRSLVTAIPRPENHRIIGATDPGYAVNPAQIDHQSRAHSYLAVRADLRECTVKDGHVEQTNFDSYNVMRIAEIARRSNRIIMPPVFWGGVGEPTICVAAPAVLTRSSPDRQTHPVVTLKNQNIRTA